MGAAAVYAAVSLAVSLQIAARRTGAAVRGAAAVVFCRAALRTRNRNTVWLAAGDSAGRTLEKPQRDESVSRGDEKTIDVLSSDDGIGGAGAVAGGSGAGDQEWSRVGRCFTVECGPGGREAIQDFQISNDGDEMRKLWEVLRRRKMTGASHWWGEFCERSKLDECRNC